MYLSKKELVETDRVRRLNLINSATGVKPANLIGTISSAEVLNLAIFSSVVHLGSDPALYGFVMRSDKEVRRHTLENILETKVYTINNVHRSFTERAHYTSAKFASDESEFEKCGIEEEYLFGFEAPFVRSSQVKLGMKFVELIPIEVNGTILVIGEILHLIVPEDAVSAEGQIDLEKSGNIGISGLDSYYRLEKFATFPYARPDELPETLSIRSNEKDQPS